MRFRNALSCFCLLGLTACEDKNNSSQRPTYTFTGKEVSSSQTKVVIPSTYDKKTVTSIGANAFDNNANLTSVVIPKTVTRISEYAFNKCYNLTSVSFESGSNLTTIYADSNWQEVATNLTGTNGLFAQCYKLHHQN